MMTTWRFVQLSCNIQFYSIKFYLFLKRINNNNNDNNNNNNNINNNNKKNYNYNTVPTYVSLEITQFSKQPRLVIRVHVHGKYMISFPCLPMQLLLLLSYHGILNPVLHLQ